MGQSNNYQVNYKKVTVKVADGSMISGKINIQEFRRLSDMLKNDKAGFITTVSADDGPKRTTIINREYIMWAETED